MQKVCYWNWVKGWTFGGGGGGGIVRGDGGLELGRMGTDIRLLTGKTQVQQQLFRLSVSHRPLFSLCSPLLSFSVSHESVLNSSWNRARWSVKGNVKDGVDRGGVCASNAIRCQREKCVHMERYGVKENAQERMRWERDKAHSSQISERERERERKRKSEREGWGIKGRARRAQTESLYLRKDESWWRFTVIFFLPHRESSSIEGIYRFNIHILFFHPSPYLDWILWTLDYRGVWKILKSFLNFVTRSKRVLQDIN